MKLLAKPRGNVFDLVAGQIEHLETSEAFKILNFAYAVVRQIQLAKSTQHLELLYPRNDVVA